MTVLSAGSLSRNIVKTAGKQALNKISLPTINELASLSKTAVQALDPGFELLTVAGKYSVSGLRALFGLLKVGMGVEDTIKMEGILNKIEKSAAIKKASPPENLLAETAYLTDAKIKVPVKIVKKEGGNNYYAIVDPETMELLEGIYTIQKGELKLISERPNKWSHKADINNPDTASPQSVKENRPCRQPFREVVLSSVCPKRVKRGIEELCKSRPYADIEGRAIWRRLIRMARHQ